MQSRHTTALVVEQYPQTEPAVIGQVGYPEISHCGDSADKAGIVVVEGIVGQLQVEREKQLAEAVEQYRRASTAHFTPREEEQREYVLTHPLMPVTQVMLARQLKGVPLASGRVTASVMLRKFQEDPARPGTIFQAKNEDRSISYTWDPLATSSGRDAPAVAATRSKRTGGSADESATPRVKRGAKPVLAPGRARKPAPEPIPDRRFEAPEAPQIERDSQRGATVLRAYSLKLDHDGQTIHCKNTVVADDPYTVEIIQAVAEVRSGLGAGDIWRLLKELPEEQISLRGVINRLTQISEIFSERQVNGWSYGWTKDANGQEREIARFDDPAGAA